MANEGTTPPGAGAPGAAVKPTKIYYCWIRLVHMSTNTARAPVEPEDPPQPLNEADHRPPGGVGQSLLHGPSEADHRPPGAVGLQSRPNRASPVLWFAPEAYFGFEDAETTFEYGPAFDKFDAARQWIQTDAGASWDRGALNRLLMAVAVN